LRRGWQKKARCSNEHRVLSGCAGALVFVLSSRTEAAGTPFAPSKNAAEKPERADYCRDDDNGFDWHQNAPWVEEFIVMPGQLVSLIQIKPHKRQKTDPN
jgi:hypothetical protein